VNRNLQHHASAAAAKERRDEDDVGLSELAFVFSISSAVRADSSPTWKDRSSVIRRQNLTQALKPPFHSRNTPNKLLQPTAEKHGG
jgi:hypothetical protein